MLSALNYGLTERVTIGLGFRYIYIASLLSVNVKYNLIRKKHFAVSIGGSYFRDMQQSEIYGGLPIVFLTAGYRNNWFSISSNIYSAGLVNVNMKFKISDYYSIVSENWILLKNSTYGYHNEFICIIPKLGLAWEGNFITLEGGLAYSGVEESFPVVYPFIAITFNKKSNFSMEII